MKKKNLLILASGSGSNAENIARYLQGHAQLNVSHIATNNKNAFVLERAKNLGIEASVFSKEELISGEIVKNLSLEKFDLVVLAGFMMLIPEYLIKMFPDRIVNIHPALLPNYGGKGMYGDHVHRAVITNKEEVSGITIHLVNDKYDEGRMLFQAICPVESTDTSDSLAAKVHALEYEHYPRVIEEYLLGL